MMLMCNCPMGAVRRRSQVNRFTWAKFLNSAEQALLHGAIVGESISCNVNDNDADPKFG